jgi:hypothetical protein
LRNVNTGAFEVYDIANNQLTGAAPLGSVGLDWRFRRRPSDGIGHIHGYVERSTRAGNGRFRRRQRRSRELEHCPSRCRHITAVITDDTAARVTMTEAAYVIQFRRVATRTGKRS